MMQTCCRRSFTRPLKFARASSSHDDHHHAVDYQYLEKPAIKPEDFTLFGQYKSFDAIPELQSANLIKTHGDLLAPRNKPDVCWSEQVISSPSVLACLSELFSSEFRFMRHSVPTLKALYKQQHAAFTYVRTPQLQAEGISQVTIDLLEEMYSIRANISDFQVTQALKKCGMLREREKTWLPPLRAWYRAYKGEPIADNPNEIDTGINASNWYRNPAIRGITNNYRRATHKTMLSRVTQELRMENQPGGFDNFADYAHYRVQTARKIQTLVGAIKRGLTEPEKAKLIAKLKDFQGMNTIDNALDKELTVALQAAVKAYEQNKDVNALQASLTAFRKQYVDDLELPATSRVHAKQLYYKALKAVGMPQEDADHPTDLDGLYLREGVDYFAGEEQRKSVLEEVTAWFRFKASQAHHDAMTNGTPERKQQSAILKQATDLFLTPSIQSDLEILSLLRHSELSHKQVDEFLSIIETKEPAADDQIGQLNRLTEDKVLFNLLFPHRLTSTLFGDIYTRFLGQDHVEYTKQFIDGSDSIIPRDTEVHPRPIIQRRIHSFTQEGRLLTPNFTSTDFATAQDYSNHMKLMRLFQDYYGIDMTSEEGMAMIDQLVHNYDISSGEQTLERSQPVAMPMHSFDELPIMKYDGYDDCPYEPEHDTTAKDMDTSAIEQHLSAFCQKLASATGEPVTLSSFRENNKLSDTQYKVLRSILHLKSPDLGATQRDIEVIERMWSIVLPPAELEKLFHDQYTKFSDNEGHH